MKEVDIYEINNKWNKGKIELKKAIRNIFKPLADIEDEIKLVIQDAKLNYVQKVFPITKKVYGMKK